MRTVIVYHLEEVSPERFHIYKRLAYGSPQPITMTKNNPRSRPVEYRGEERAEEALRALMKTDVQYGKHIGVRVVHRVTRTLYRY